MNVFLAHGSFGKPFENWFPWLEEELSKKEIICTIPSFPTPEHQTYEDWERLMDYYCDIGIVNSETILIGHSCGSVFLVKYLLKHKIRVAGLITVCGYNNFHSGNDMMDKLNGSFYINEDSINVRNYANRIISFYSDNDPHIPMEILCNFAENIGAEKVVVNNAGHFNLAAGYDKFDMILNALNI